MLLAEEKLLLKAASIRKLIKEAQLEGHARAQEAERGTVEAYKMVADATQLPARARSDAEAAEVKSLEAMRELENANIVVDESKRLAVNAEREAQWIKQETMLLHMVMGHEVPDDLAQSPRGSQSPRVSSPSFSGKASGGRDSTGKSKVKGGGLGCLPCTKAPPAVDDPAGEPAMEPPGVEGGGPSETAGAPSPTNAALVVPRMPRMQRAMSEDPDTPKFDGLAWAPLKLQLPTNKVDLLLGLALCGIYNRSDVCELVAREVSLQDHTLLEHALTKLAARQPQPPFSLPVLTEVRARVRVGVGVASGCGCGGVRVGVGVGGASGGGGCEWGWGWGGGMVWGCRVGMEVGRRIVCARRAISNSLFRWSRSGRASF